MAQDVKLVQDDQGILDIPVDGNDLEGTDGLLTAIIVSLFTDARGNSSVVADAYKRRGWVGNLLTLNEGYELGSTLWLLEQARLNQNTAIAAEGYARKSLQWMIDDGIVDVIEVEFVQTSVREGTLTVSLFKDQNRVARYTTLWNNTSETN